MLAVIIPAQLSLARRKKRYTVGKLCRTWAPENARSWLYLDNCVTPPLVKVWPDEKFCRAAHDIKPELQVQTHADEYLAASKIC
jgi:hypothetical protein